MAQKWVFGRNRVSTTALTRISQRKRRSSSASIAKQKPHFTSEPVYQEPTPDDFMEDFFQENFIEDSPDSGMVPLDKDSIMS